MSEDNIFPEWLQRTGIENITPDGQHGRIDVTGQYAIQLPDVVCRAIIVKAHASNTHTINVGIYERLTPDNGFALSPGDSLSFRIDNVDKVGVCWELPVPEEAGIICWYAEIAG